MTLLSAMQNVAKNVGVKQPLSITGNNTGDAVKLLQFANEAGDELARRVDWHQMRKTVSVVGTGFPALLDIRPDYARMVQGLSVIHNGEPVRGGLTADEWNSLPERMGAPRYYQTVGQKIGFYPYLEEGATVGVTYISTGWTSAGKSAFTNDDDTTLFPERLLEMGTVWRFKRHISADYSDYLAEFESALNDFAAADGGVRLP